MQTTTTAPTQSPISEYRIQPVPMRGPGYRFAKDCYLVFQGKQFVESFGKLAAAETFVKSQVA